MLNRLLMLKGLTDSVPFLLNKKRIAWRHARFAPCVAGTGGISGMSATGLLIRMLRFSKKPRYPQKRGKRRITLILALLPLLFLFLVTAVVMFTGTSDKSATSGIEEVNELAFEESYPQGVLPGALRFDRLVLEKQKRRLTAYSKGSPVRVYLVALGAAPEGHKEIQGDMRTPEGKYTINDKNPHSAYYKNLGISYPNNADRKHAKALGKSPGGDIKIHGLAPDFAYIGSAHRLTDWTYGCIAVTNEEMEELFHRTPIGTPIEIFP